MTSDQPPVNRSKPIRKEPSTARIAVRQAVIIEASVKLTVNLLLAVVAGSTLAKLVPHNRSQQAELDIQQEAVQALEQDTDVLWNEFSRNFDPQQASSVMRSQSGRENPDQKQVVWVNPLADE